MTTSEALHQVLAKSHLSDRSQTLTSTSTPIINGDKSISSLDSAITQLSSPESPTSTWFSNTPETDRAWDEFPNGRWGDSRSPAYGEMDGYGASLKMTVSRESVCCDLQFVSRGEKNSHPSHLSHLISHLHLLPNSRTKPFEPGVTQ